MEDIHLLINTQQLVHFVLLFLNVSQCNYVIFACTHVVCMPQVTRQTCQRRLACCAAKQNGNNSDLYKLLDVSPRSSRADIRAAYIAKIKVMHPDISTDDGATTDAAALNAAYTALMVSSLPHLDAISKQYMQRCACTQLAFSCKRHSCL